jgi:hypothetical protein
MIVKVCGENTRKWLAEFLEYRDKDAIFLDLFVKILFGVQLHGVLEDWRFYSITRQSAFMPTRTITVPTQKCVQVVVRRHEIRET